MSQPVLHFPAAERNREPIRAALETLLPGQGSVLEVASGSGQHVEYFAQAFPQHAWQPSDPDPAHRRSVDARVYNAGLSNVAPALPLDVCGDWPSGEFDVIYAANLLHVAPLDCTTCLFVGAAKVLSEAGRLLIYGPFMIDGQHNSPGNAQFDERLRAEDARLGLRDVNWLHEVAVEQGLRLTTRLAMPANNQLLVFAR